MSSILHRVRQIVTGTSPFRSAPYWERRYRGSGTSGDGSYGRLAEFKAEVLNRFVQDNGVRRVLELGCGDGNQLSLAIYPEYMGFDVAPTAVKICRRRFAGRPWSFHLYSREKVADVGRRFGPDLVISLDVIFHLVEDNAFQDYMRTLFSLSPTYVVIYSSNGNFRISADHIRNWKFTEWIAVNAPQWRLAGRIPNPYPWDDADPGGTSFCDFFIFEREGGGGEAVA